MSKELQHPLPGLSESQTLEVFIEYESNGLQNAVRLMNAFREINGGRLITMADGMIMVRREYLEYIKK